MPSRPIKLDDLRGPLTGRAEWDAPMPRWGRGVVILIVLALHVGLLWAVLRPFKNPPPKTQLLVVMVLKETAQKPEKQVQLPLPKLRTPPVPQISQPVIAIKAEVKLADELPTQPTSPPKSVVPPPPPRRPAP